MKNYIAEIRKRKLEQRELKRQQERESVVLFKQDAEGLVKKK